MKIFLNVALLCCLSQMGYGWESADEKARYFAEHYDEPYFPPQDVNFFYKYFGIFLPGDFGSTNQAGRFSNTGFQSSPLGLTQAAARAVVYEDPGKFVVAGWFNNGTVGSFLARYWLDGSLDTTFGTSGVASFSFAGETTLVHALVGDSASRYIVAGKRGANGSGNFQFMVARFTTGGILDTNFAITGLTTVGFNDSQIARAVDVDSNDRIVVAGYGEAGYIRNLDVAIARLNTDGTLDSTFDGDGKVLTEMDPYGHDIAYAVKVLNDGRIGIVGTTNIHTNFTDNGDLMAARYLTDGRLDSTFDSDGYASATISNNDLLFAFDTDSSNRFVGCGRQRQSATAFRAVFARFATDGSLDTANTLNLNNRHTCRGIRVDTTGKYLLGGHRRGNVASDFEFYVARLLTDGTFDTGFSTNGWDELDITGGENDHGRAITFHDEKFIIVGRIDSDLTAGVNYEVALVRYDSRGVEAGGGDLDVYFQSTGYNDVDVSGDTDQGESFIMDSSGRFLLAGWTENGNANTRDIGVVRFLSTGDVDTTFGVAGIASTNFPTNDRDEAYNLVEDSTGLIYVSGFRENGNNATRDYAIVRYLTSGVVDTTWGAAGFVNADFSGDRDEGRAGVAVGTNNLIYAGGWVENGNSATRDFGVVRYDSTGTIDTTYGTAGWATADFDGRRDEAEAMVLTSDDKIIIVGYAEVGGAGAANREIAIARFTSGGILDTSWSGDGLLTVDIEPALEDAADAINIQSDGNILVAGTLQNTTDAVILMRFLTDGSFDTTFGTTSSGMTIAFANNTTNEIVSRISFSHNGKILVSGRGGGPGMIARFDYSGALETYGDPRGFGRPNAPNADYMEQVYTQADGRYITGGRAVNSFVIYRIWP